MFPYEIKPIDGEDGEELLKLFKGNPSGFVEVGPKKWVFTAEYAKHADKYYNFEVREDDVWIMTFPRSGTTWMQEIIWQVNNNVDLETTSKVPLFERCPFYEFNTMFDAKFMEELAELPGQNMEEFEKFKTPRSIPGYEILENMESPRHIKTHLPPSLSPPALMEGVGKVIYVARNPLDVAASFYHHNLLFTSHGFVGDFQQYWNLFEKDLILFAPYWEHLKEAWELRNNKNFLFLFYEDLIRDLPGHLLKIAQFLNKELSDEQIERLTEHLYIDNFRKNVKLYREQNVIGTMNPNAQDFIRRGKIGGNSEYDEELQSRADKWFQENLAKTEIEFPKF